LRSLAGRAGLNEREVAIFRGICRRSQGLFNRLQGTGQDGESP